MSELINRQDAIMHFVKVSGNYECGIFSLAEVTHELWEIPSAERKGKWIRHDEIKNVYGGIYIECSECGEKYVVQHIEDEKYCPNCGASMVRGEEDV